ncbi:MAG TPA: DUF4139 domain-containing protein, partial [Polyangiaceae bacterium]|nr:DUF4139 domain-containing protein [Polyangiaceae bacterium]
SSFETTTHVTRVQLRNLGSQPKAIEVVERIPVSEIEKVVIELDRELTRPAPTRFESGFVTWQIQLAAYSSLELQLTHIVRRHSDVHGI